MVPSLVGFFAFVAADVGACYLGVADCFAACACVCACVCIRVCIAQGSTGPAGSAGNSGAQGAPVSDLVT